MLMPLCEHEVGEFVAGNWPKKNDFDWNQTFYWHLFSIVFCRFSGIFKFHFKILLHSNILSYKRKKKCNLFRFSLTVVFFLLISLMVLCYILFDILVVVIKYSRNKMAIMTIFNLRNLKIITSNITFANKQNNLAV